MRRAAQTASARLGLGNLPAYSPEEAITNAFDADLRQIVAMVLTPIPAEAPFVRLTIDLRPSDPRLPRTEAVYGWLLGQPGDTYHVLDEYAQERDLPKNRTTFVPTTLAARAQELRQIREEEARAGRDVGDGARSLSRHGSFSGQFEPGQLRLPEILIGVWAYQRQDKTSAAALLLPRFEELADRRWPREIARDLLGHDYHQQMLTRWADYWDYPGTLRLAKHLTSALFDGYAYEGRAARLLEQVPRRAEQDFHTLALPTPAQWHRQRRQLARAEQTQFLLDRLRLISCRQLGWPCDVKLTDEQRSEPVNGSIYADVDRVGAWKSSIRTWNCGRWNCGSPNWAC